MTSSDATRTFVLGKQVDSQDDYFRYLDRGIDWSVYVELTDGTTDRHVGGRYRRREYGAAEGAAFLDSATYLVLPSGALAVAITRRWTEGWEPGVNDSANIMRTYAPGTWASVAGDFFEDPVAAAFESSEPRQRSRDASREVTEEA